MKKQDEDVFEPAIPVVPKGWDVLPFEQAVDVISDKSKRVKQSTYLPSGKVPVTDQGQDFIGGYTDDEDMAFEGELPVILFGDHTRSIKYVDRSFAVGAEGVKILKPSGGFDPKFFYYLLRSLQIPSRGSFPRAPRRNKKNPSPRKQKNNPPASTKPSPASSASRPTSSATKPPSSKPPSKAASSKPKPNLLAKKHPL